MDTNRHEAVAGVGDPGNQRNGEETTITDRGYNFPNSRRVYVGGQIHPNIRVPFREILLAPTKPLNGEIEVNEPVRVYDTSGPWGDPDFHGNVEQGLPPLRAKWIRGRRDVEECEGRKVQPIDDGWLSEVHARSAQQKRPTPNAERTEGESLNSQLSTINCGPAPPAPRALWPLRHAALLRAPGNHHPGDGVHCNPREHGTRSAQIRNPQSEIRVCPQRSALRA